MPAMGSQAAAVLAISDAIELLEKLDRELLTSDAAEQLFRHLDASPRTRDPETVAAPVRTPAIVAAAPGGRRPVPRVAARPGAEASTDMPLGVLPDSPDSPFCYASGFAFNSASWSLINALISSVMESNVVHCSL